MVSLNLLNLPLSGGCDAEPERESMRNVPRVRYGYNYIGAIVGLEDDREIVSPLEGLSLSDGFWGRTIARSRYLSKRQSASVLFLEQVDLSLFYPLRW
jgi:hypothetical protein